MRYFFIVLTVVSLSSCGQHEEKQVQPTATTAAIQTVVDTYPVKDGWGYSISVNGQKFIRQETIPVIQGERPFATKTDAEKIGRWVAQRIGKNERFSITLPVLQELVSLKNLK